jgi:protein NrfC
MLRHEWINNKGEGNGNMKKEQTRREFLQVTGTIVFLVGSGCYLPAVEESAEPKAPKGPLKSAAGIPASDGYLLVDTKKCQGCASCMLACSLVHEGLESLSLSRIQIMQNSFKAFPADVSIEQCRQCVDPACVKACPAGALRANPEYGNVRMVDRDKCIGCGACFAACPFKPSRPVVTADERYKGEIKSRKCDLCADTPYHWDKAGGGPKGRQACVEVCPVGAIKFSKGIPIQEGDAGYRVNLRGASWRRLGYPAD